MSGSERTWQSRAEAVLAQGCLTYSKSRQYYTLAQPSHVTGSDGQYLIDTDGRPFLDTVSGLGPNILDIRNTYSLPSTLEVECAEKVLHRLGRQGWKVKFVKTGSEADQAAVRFARGYTGRRGVLRLGYSGWHNEFISAEEPGVGCIPTDVTKVGSHDELVERLRAEGPVPAAVIMEPVMLDMDVKPQLKKIREITQRKDIVLIFDEVITCMRMPQYSVAKTFDIWPDIMTTGKALGNGMALGVVMGCSDIMDTEGVFVSGTFSGETSALESCMGLLAEVGPDRMRQWYGACNDLMVRLQWALKGKIEVVGYGTRMVLRERTPGSDMVPRYMQEMWRRHRILIGPVLFPRFGWDNHCLGKLVYASEDVAKGLEGVELIGRPPSPIFKRN